MSARAYLLSLYMVFSLVLVCACSDDADDNSRGGGTADTAGDTGGDAPSSDSCDCVCSLPVGTAFRFDTMTCDLPVEVTDEATQKQYGTLCDVLNSIWERDIGKDVQTVLYEIRHTGTCGSDDLKFTTEIGSGGKRLADGTPCPKAGAVDCDGRFSLLDGYHESFEAEVAGCGFEGLPGGDWMLPYHPGDDLDPVLCAPENEFADGIAFMKVESSGAFTSDCSEVIDGRLRGCFPKKDALRLCLCNDLSYQSCVRAPGGAGAASYCGSHCGPDYGMNFGSFVADVVGLPVNCDIDGDGVLDDGPDSPDGWTITGTFSAKRLPTDQYTPMDP